MKTHANKSQRTPAAWAERTPAAGSIRRRRQGVLSFLAIAIALIASVGLSSCTGLTTNAASGSKSATDTTQGVGILSPATNSLSFGNVAVGSSTTQSVSLTNTGTASVSISQATV